MDEGRKILWFLGAGASRAAGANYPYKLNQKIAIPTQSDFWRIILKFAPKPERSEIQSFLFKYFTEYRRVPANSGNPARAELLSSINVEEVFTFLSERINSPSTSPQLKSRCANIWQVLIKNVSSTFSLFKANAQTRKEYSKLIDKDRRLLLSRDAIVSFNYDCVFEGSIHNRKKWHYAGIESQSGSLPIIKPHGSINWKLSQGKIIATKSKVEFPVIVAPSHLKFIQRAVTQDENPESSRVAQGYLNQHAQIDDIWRELEKAVKNIKAFVFIGYSFPAADLYFSSVLRSALALRDVAPKVVLVNHDAVRIKERITERFPIPSKRVKIIYDLKSLLETSRKSLLDTEE